MVKILAICLLTFIICKAQTWDELFSQKKTQIRYLGEQIAALHLYAGYLKKGYEIAKNGINTIKDIKSGEFNLHNSFINSLKVVNPAIRNSAKVAGIIEFQLDISRTFGSIKDNSYLSASDQEYISRVKSQIRDECSHDLDELLLIIISGKVEMKDDERIKRLDKVYDSIKDKSAFTQSFCNEVNMLIVQREQEAKEESTEKKLYGITQ